jgi:gluconolactonase
VEQPESANVSLDVVVLDHRMRELVPSETATKTHAEALCTGAIWSEGPVYLPGEDAVVWSDIPNNRMLRWSAADAMTVFRAPADFSNGNTLDAEGRIVHCSHGLRAITRTEHDGSTHVLVDRWEGRRFNSPNDLVVRPDGSIWFTDPPYGILSDREGYKSDPEIWGNHVYRFDPVTGELRVMVTDVEEPNGLAFSPDSTTLYVADTSAASKKDGTGNHHIRAYRVVGERVLDGRVFCVVTPGLADGFRLDVNGNIFTSSEDAIQVFAPDGVLIGRIPIPERVSNCCWGGPERNVLYITASSSLYRITLATTGAGLLW